MLLNATLLRLDPAAGPPTLPDFAVRCAATAPSAAQSLAALTAGAALTLVVYVKSGVLPAGATPEVGGEAKVRLDADGSETTLRVNRVLARSGRLGHAELWLAPTASNLVACPCAGGGGG